MSDHDPWCPRWLPEPFHLCQCALIAKVRADERERHTVNNPMLLADLRAKVDALPTWSRLAQDDLVQRADVLALLDGDGHE